MSVTDAWGDTYTDEEWAVARALGRVTSLDPETLLPDAREAIEALDSHRAEQHDQ